MSLPELLEQLLNTDVAKMAVALLLTMPIAYDRKQAAGRDGPAARLP